MYSTLSTLRLSSARSKRAVRQKHATSLVRNGFSSPQCVATSDRLHPTGAQAQRKIAAGSLPVRGVMPRLKLSSLSLIISLAAACLESTADNYDNDPNSPCTPPPLLQCLEQGAVNRYKGKGAPANRMARTASPHEFICSSWLNAVADPYAANLCCLLAQRRNGAEWLPGELCYLLHHSGGSPRDVGIPHFPRRSCLAQPRGFVLMLPEP